MLDLGGASSIQCPFQSCQTLHEKKIMAEGGMVRGARVFVRHVQLPEKSRIQTKGRTEACGSCVRRFRSKDFTSNFLRTTWNRLKQFGCFLTSMERDPLETFVPYSRTSPTQFQDKSSRIKCLSRIKNEELRTPITQPWTPHWFPAKIFPTETSNIKHTTAVSKETWRQNNFARNLNSTCLETP